MQSPDPQRGIGMLPKRGCDVSTCEITRFYRLNNNGFCQVIPFVVPRKSELFQEDLYPDTVSDVPAITADEWWLGANADPIMVPMNERGVQIKKVGTRAQFHQRSKHSFCANSLAPVKYKPKM
jgi:coronin-1B/1C/6